MWTMDPTLRPSDPDDPGVTVAPSERATGNPPPGRPTFGDQLRQFRTGHGLSLAALSKLTSYNRGYISNIERGIKPPNERFARAVDRALGSGGRLIAAEHLDQAAKQDTRPWQTAELLGRIQASDTTPGTLDALQATVFELCCQYPYRNAAQLRAESQGWLQHVGKLVRKPVGLREHTELLVSAGWLALLIGCLEYDLGMRTAAETTRRAARSIGDEAGSSEIVGWSWEMSAWYALTQGRYRDVITAAEAGRAADRGHSVHVQLIAQQAKAQARIGDPGAVRSLDLGREILDRLPRPERTDHHFVVDPAKWGFYAMDAFRIAGRDDLAEQYACAVLTDGRRPDGTEQSPMRMAEARLTLATVAARAGDLEQAVALGAAALGTDRVSLPSLVLVASELDGELQHRFPAEPAASGYRDLLRGIRDGHSGTAWD